MKDITIINIYDEYNDQTDLFIVKGELTEDQKEDIEKKLNKYLSECKQDYDQIYYAIKRFNKENIIQLEEGFMVGFTLYKETELERKY
jgi:aerobic-type carbon monoxide dehydrogenase small subunit (CoxS/CutS family)